MKHEIDAVILPKGIMTDDRPAIEETYGSAITSSNLRSIERTTRSASDVLGAAGIAARTSPLAMALLRLFVGDGRSADEIVDILCASIVGKAYRMRVTINATESRQMAQAVLAWHRDSVCKPCGGLGYLKIDGAPSLSGNLCPKCHGSTRIPFESQFPAGWQDLARWLLTEIEREQAIAGPLAMAKLAPRLDL